MQEEVGGGAARQEGSEEGGGLAYAWMRVPARSRTSIVIFTLCLFVYTLLLLVFPRYKGSPTTRGDEPHYLIITESVIRDGDLDLENNYELEQYASYFEQDIMMLHVTRDNVSTHPMFLSLLVLPGFRLLGYKGAALTMILLTCGAAALTFATADRFASRKVAGGVTLFGFLSYPLLFYSRSIYPETAAIFLLALGTWSCWRLKESGQPTFAFLGGLSAGMVVLFHPKYIAISIALFVLFLIVTPGRTRRLLGWWLLPAALSLALLLLLTGITYGPNLLKGLTASGGSKFQGGFWGTNSVWGIPGLFLDRAWGLLIFAPLYLLSPIGLALQNNRLEWERWWAFFPLCIGLHALFLGTFQSWNGGAAPVQRYLVPLVPLLLICVAVFIDRCASRVAHGAAAAFALLQIIVSIWAFRFMVGTYGMENTDNIFFVHFLGEGAVKRFLMFVFPLYHPGSPGAVLLTVAWILLYAAAIYAARRYYLSHGGGRVSPIVDIRPFRRLAS
ncbi:MAG: hypothetical protein KJ686_07140 [Actinobacteria bacterium]|nr:hypothetical protein [Actinomycetota bacterium]